MPDEAPMTDEDRQIYQLQLHRDLVGWTIGQLEQVGIASRRTRGNDPKGDILILDAREASQVKEIVRNLHNQYNRGNSDDLELTLASRETNLPHIEIKSTYLFGKEIDEIIQTGTVIAIVSADRISKPGKAKLVRAGVVYAENIPLSEFLDVER